MYFNAKLSALAGVFSSNSIMTAVCWQFALTSYVIALLNLNPMTPLIAAFRGAVLGGPVPWSGLAVSSAVAVLVFLAACFYYRRVEDSFADVI